MEAAKSLFYSSPPFQLRTNHWSAPPSSSSPSSSSVLMFHEQATPAVNSRTASFAAQHFPTSVLLQEQRDEYKPILRTYKDEKISQATLNTRQMDIASIREDYGNADKLVDDFKQQLQMLPHLLNLLTSLPTGEIATSSAVQPVTFDSERPAEGEQSDAIALAKRALSASKHAASVAEDLKSFKPDNDDDLLSLGLAFTSFDDTSIGKTKTVRSTRLLERRSKKRKKPKSFVQDDESYANKKSDVQAKLLAEKKINEGFDQNDPLRLFLWGPETKQLLTLEEESQLIVQLQDLLRLEGTKKRLQSQFGREPTLAEWAEGVGLSCKALQLQLQAGNSSRDKLIYSNLRMVVHIAKHYQGRGLSFQDLLQEGSMGLMKSVEKFKPQAGCRFGTYAYWWIRQTIRKAIFQHSRTIRLPENVYTILGKVMEAKKLYIQEGNLHPTKEELSRRVGITVDKLEKLLFVARIPLSMQQTVWADQDTTFQEITADSAIEIPDVSVAKQLMRRHVRNLLSILSPKERRIIRLRFGLEDGEQKSLSEIGNVFGLSKERVRQLESRAFYKLKQSLSSQGLNAYADLLV